MKETLSHYYEETLAFFRSPLGRQMLIYFFFYAFLWGFHLILISLVSYFHLLLNHNIRTIGDWIGDRGWTLIIISKLVVFYLTMLFVNLKTKKIFSLKSYFRNSIQTPRLEVFVAILFLIIGLMGIAEMRFNKTMIVEIDRLILSIAGTFIFFSVDYVLLVILDVFYPIRDDKTRLKRIFLFPFLFYFFTAATFVYEQTITFKLYPLFFLLLYSGEWRRKNWTLPALFLSVFIIPAFSLMSLDPVWGEIYSPFAPTRKIGWASFLILVAFAVGYLQYTLKKKPEYIYRD
ncbi:hypothetical protein DOM21_04485 [Bacteriovorax stolpii]|uniref:Uncharacterized protein n=1 Tax=Bacteriovorax stolpii TaxID=960 RepID=A0A2K9NUT8_BACTC|nr:hypothetical protein [Bacteriovorax stolpii]AUN99296.1 hypothetical protein C0V70_14515 [Bacteriovorax stolpii]QDK40723.1 hypothetical protein DOM21_04485 [Bacteriovorax stolpii]TDP55164.1 hypothetical protein C8D79_0207 [Bacteriovorax stolpii]